MEYTHVEGKDSGVLVLYALSTCLWCRRVKELLDSEGVKYSYIYVDRFEGAEGKRLDEIVRKWNPKESFPVLVINDEMAIVGYKAEEIRKAITGGLLHES